MSANNFFENHSLEEISKKTKISPISLRFIKNKEYEKIPRVKFLGFIKIIEREYKVDLSHLIEEYDTANNIPHKHHPSPKEELAKIPEIESDKKHYLIIVLATILLLIVGYLLWNYTKKPKEERVSNPAIAHIETNTTEVNDSEKNESIKTSAEQNITPQNIQPQNVKLTEINTSIKPQPVVEDVSENLTKNTEVTDTKAVEKYEVTIIPRKKVWFRAINLDTNKTISTITSGVKTLPKGNYYIKFGHGLIDIEYNGKTISPNTKQIVRIELKNGEYKLLKNPPKGYPK